MVLPLPGPPVRLLPMRLVPVVTPPRTSPTFATWLLIVSSDGLFQNGTWEFVGLAGTAGEAPPVDAHDTWLPRNVAVGPTDTRLPVPAPIVSANILPLSAISPADKSQIFFIDITPP